MVTKSSDIAGKSGKLGGDAGKTIKSPVEGSPGTAQPRGPGTTKPGPKDGPKAPDSTTGLPNRD